MVQPLVDAGVNPHVIDVINLYSFLHYRSGTVITAFPIPHNVPNCGWHIDIDGYRIFYATDCATLDGIEAKNYDLYMIEANHTRAEIEARIADKHAAGQFAYEEAAARNHLSREQAEDWLARNAGEHSKYVFLHQHAEKTSRGVKDGA